MSFSDFTKNENKSIIWGLLQEGGVFNDIPNTYFENIKRLFESSILSNKILIFFSIKMTKVMRIMIRRHQK